MHIFSACIKTQVVCCAAQENGARTNGVSILTGTTKLWFSRIHISIMLDSNGTKFTVEVPSTQGKQHSKFEEDSFSHSRDTSNQTFKKFFVFFSFSSFCILCKNHYNLYMWTSIWLKFGTLIGGLKEIPVSTLG